MCQIYCQSLHIDELLLTDPFFVLLLFFFFFFSDTHTIAIEFIRVLLQEWRKGVMVVAVRAHVEMDDLEREGEQHVVLVVVAAEVAVAEIVMNF